MTDLINGLPVLEFRDAEAFELWLEANAGARGAWLRFSKKGAAAVTLAKKDAIDCALCHGWIDGQLGGGGDDCFLTRFTPRKPGGRWSANNARRADELVALGRMRARGLTEIAAARADGRWEAAYPSATAAVVPEDFTTALARNAKASAFFETLDGANRYALLYRLHHAKGDARGRLIVDFVEMLARGEKFHEPRKARQRAAGRIARPSLRAKRSNPRT